MEKNLYIDASHPDETRIVLKSGSSIEEYEYENKNKINFKNNIYLGTISRVEPSLQAAFVNFGRVKHGFLAFNDIQSDYYQIPQSDLEKIKKEEEKEREKLQKESEQQEEKNLNEGNLEIEDPVEKKPDSTTTEKIKTTRLLKNDLILPNEDRLQILDTLIIDDKIKRLLILRLKASLIFLNFSKANFPSS